MQGKDLDIPSGINTYPADLDTSGLSPESIIREAAGKPRSKEHGTISPLEAMVDAQMITEMKDNKLQL